MNRPLYAYMFACISLISCAAYGADNSQTTRLCNLAQKHTTEIDTLHNKITGLQPQLEAARDAHIHADILCAQRNIQQILAHHAWKNDHTNNNLLAAMFESNNQYLGAAVLALHAKHDVEAIEAQIDDYTKDIEVTQGLLDLTQELINSEQNHRHQIMLMALTAQIAQWDQTIKELESLLLETNHNQQ